MKKFAIVVIILICVFSISGCKKESKEQTNTVVNEAGTENQIGDNNTVGGDVYSESSTILTDAPIDYKDVKGTPVTDDMILSDLQAYIEKFYYNFLFAPKSELGEVTEMDMQLFAISYIYQYEYTELRFDADEFVLYIPDDYVSEVIKRFFDYDFVNHRYPLDSKVTYKDGYYLMPARDEDFGPQPKSTILKLSDFDYKVVFTATRDGIEEAFEAIIEEREGRYILLNYKKNSKPETEPIDSTTP